MRCFAGARKPLRDIQQELDSGNPHVAGFALAGVTRHADDARSFAKSRPARNVVAYLPATGSTGPASEKPWVVIGAHYDHLGHGDRGNSLAAQGRGRQIHHGADDNASGTAAVLAHRRGAREAAARGATC